MKLGIDFGTSNSAAAAIVDGQVVPVRFGEALQFRTAVYFPETMRDPDDFSLTPALEYKVKRLIDSGRRDALAAARTFNNASLRRDAIRDPHRAQAVDGRADARTTQLRRLAAKRGLW